MLNGWFHKAVLGNDVFFELTVIKKFILLNEFLTDVFKSQQLDTAHCLMKREEGTVTLKPPVLVDYFIRWFVFLFTLVSFLQDKPAALPAVLCAPAHSCKMLEFLAPL